MDSDFRQMRKRHITLEIERLKSKIARYQVQIENLRYEYIGYLNNFSDDEKGCEE